MGELSKKIGEEGEQRVLEFFKRIGWPAPVEGIDITCNWPQKHRGSESATHGVDLIYSYICPAQSSQRRNIIVSVKNSAETEKSRPRAKLLQDINDLATAVQCFKASGLRAAILKSKIGATYADDIGVLFVMNKSDRSDLSIIQNLGGKSRFEFPGSSSMCVFENDRHDFIDNALNHRALRFPDWQMTFFHPRNTQTAVANLRLVHSTLLPVHSLLGGPLCIRLERTGPSGNKEAALLIYSQEAFSADRIQRLVAIAMELSASWVEVFVAFPDYVDVNDKNTVRSSLTGMNDASFTEKVHCMSSQLTPRKS